ncbi:MAG: hypothetical protein ABJG47_10330 [Ekhidna sp.]
MKKFFWILMLTPGIALTQELDTAVLDTTGIIAIDTAEVEPPAYYLGVYLEGGVSYEASIPGNNFLSFVGVGVQYEKWLISFNRYDFQGEVQSLIVFPNDFKLNYRYGGINIGRQLYQSSMVDLMLNAGYFKGDMTWRNLEDGQDFLRDEFDLVKINLKVEMGRFRYAKPHIVIGYQQMRNLNLAKVAGDNFSGLFFAAGIRIGYFNQ